MPFCASCGEIVRDNNRICPHCGGQVKVGLTSGFAPSSSSSSTLTTSSSTTTVPITRPPLFPSTDSLPSTTINTFHKNHDVVPPSNSQTTASSPSSSVPKPDPVPVNIHPSNHQDDHVVLCCMCLEKLDPERAKKSSLEPNKVYCHGCWAIRPIPDKHSSSHTLVNNNARQELDYQTLRGSSHVSPINTSGITNKCSICNLTLGVGTHIIAFKKQFHSSCFQCISCKQPPGDVFINRNDMPLCKSCHGKEIHNKVQATVANECNNKVPLSIPGVSTNRPTCSICRQPIFTTIVTLKGGEQRCTDCFICNKCKKPLEGSYVKRNGIILHSECVSGII